MATATKQREIIKKQGLARQANALRMRDLIRRISRQVVDTQRPRYQYGQIVTLTPVAKRATVLFPGETTAITVKMGALQPTQPGQIVRVAGLTGDRYIDDVMSGDVQFNSSDTGAEYSPDGYGAHASTTVDNREAIQAAIDAAYAAGGGIVAIKRAYSWSGDIILKSGVWLIGTRNNEGQADLTALDSTSRLIVGNWANLDWNRPGGIEKIQVDGASTGHSGGLLWLECVTTAFRSVTVSNAAGPGWYLNASQNCHFDSCDVFNSEVGFKLDNGCGGNLFSRCEISTNFTEVEIVDTAGMPNAYPFGPAHNVFIACILENYVDCEIIVRAEAGANNHFYACGLSNNGVALTSGDQVSVSNPAYPTIATYLHFDSCNFNGGGAATNERATTIHLIGNNFVHISGTTYLQESDPAYVQDAGTGVLTLDGTFYYGNNVPAATRYTSINSGSTISWIVHREQGFQFDLPANMANVIFTRRIDDTGGRGFLTRDFSFGWMDGTSFSTLATLSYDAANTRLLLTGGLRVQNQFMVGSAFDRELPSYVFAPAGGGNVTVDAAAKSVHGIVLVGTGNITSLTINNPSNGRHVRIILSTDANARTIALGSAYKFENNDVPVYLRGGCALILDMVYDSGMGYWIETGRAENVPNIASPVDPPDNTWIAPTLGNSWANFGGGFANAAYKRVGRTVKLRGLIKSGLDNVAIFTLPAGYRPPAHEGFACLVSDVTSGPASTGTAHTHTLGPRGVNVQVLSDGTVKKADALASNVYVSLSGIEFDTY